MQIKKEILLFFTLILLCITLIMAADISKENTVDPKNPETCPSNCCKNYIRNDTDTSPWNFITQGLLHFSA